MHLDPFFYLGGNGTVSIKLDGCPPPLLAGLYQGVESDLRRIAERISESVRPPRGSGRPGLSFNPHSPEPCL